MKHTEVVTKCAVTPEDYRSAAFVQSASNLGAIVHSFSRVMKKIQTDGRGKGTEWANHHPIARMYAEQIKHLTSNKSYADSYDECDKKGKENEA